MSWATPYIEALKEQATVSFRPRGNSMRPKINSGDLVTVSKNYDSLEKGDIVLCKVKGRHFLHLIKAIRGDQYQIGNNKGGINGWITEKAIYGKLTEIEK